MEKNSKDLQIARQSSLKLAETTLSWKVKSNYSVHEMLKLSEIITEILPFVPVFLKALDQKIHNVRIKQLFLVADQFCNGIFTAHGRAIGTG